ncbi:DUF4767 domain-containing protein [Lactiplantibacillus pentosus]|nr:DUF4767 domain-containing protein [Lactiplantibacillus pentosus]
MMSGLKKIVLSTTCLAVLVTLSACGGKNAQHPDSASTSRTSRRTSSSSSSTRVTSRQQTSSADSSLASASRQKKMTTDGTHMNLSEVQDGNYRSLLGGRWKMIGAKVNYHKGNGMELDTSQVDGQLSVSKDKITTGTLTVAKNGIAVDGESKTTKFDSNAETFSVSTEDEAINWAVTFYPAGSTSEYQVNGDGQTNRQNLITVWTSNNNYTQVFAQETSSTSQSTAATKKNGTLWNTSKDQQLDTFMTQWSKTMDQDYTKYDEVHDLDISTGLSYPHDLSDVIFNGHRASIAWAPTGKGTHEYNVVAIYNHNGTKPPLPNHITYFFAFKDGSPIVLVDQSRDGTPILGETENVKLKAGFARIAGN